MNSKLPPNRASGARAGEYVLARCVAEGATSEVYEGLHSTEGTLVAVKVLASEWCRHDAVVARFLNEASTLHDLRHPHLVQALAFGTLDEGRPFMVLEWRPEDLHRALKSVGGQLSERESVQVVRQLAQALILLHAHGLVHRDLKPANILVAQRGLGTWCVQLADLGLAKRLPGGSEQNSVIPVSTVGDALLGTMEYMAPEQYENPKTVNSLADVYALGVVWFELLAGRLPFTGAGALGMRFAHAEKDPPLHLLKERARPEIRALIGRMLAKTPPERPSMAEVLERLPP